MTALETREDRRVGAERLLSQSLYTSIPPSWAAGVARRVILQLLGRLRRDRLTLVEQGVDLAPRVFGSHGELHGHVEVHDPQAYVAVLREGAAGLGRGYIEGWWSSPDPVTVVRVLIRNMAAIDDARNRLHRATGGIGDRIRTLLPRDTRRRNKDDIAAHYDIGNAFFELFLDETMTYSSAVFGSPDEALADASRRKYDLLLHKLGVTADHRVLEIGTGWGGFAIRAVDTTGCRVTTTTISTQQLAEARRRVGLAGHRHKVELLDSDWRDLSGSYDRVVSIEMIEAVDWRDYDAFFATIERCLRPDGMVGIQAICLPDRRWERAKNTDEFIRRFVFPNGCLPSVGAIQRSVARATRLQLVHAEDFSAHYAETLRRWRERFDDNLDAVRELGLDDRFCRLWRFYLAYCEAGFRERHCTVYQLVFAGPEWRGRP